MTNILEWLFPLMATGVFIHGSWIGALLYLIVITSLNPNEIAKVQKKR